MKKNYIALLILAFSLPALAQEPTQKPFTSSLSGYVKNDVFADTREVTSARDGHFLLWPANISLDSAGNDINDISSFNMLAIQSRLTAKFSGPDVLKAKISGVIEGDFFGQTNTNVNLFRMRLAYIKMNWKNIELISGQYWNPLFVTGCFPATLSFNTGTPFNSFARSPQIRLTLTSEKISLVGAMVSQLDNTSRSIAGASSSYLRYAIIPDLHAQIQYETKNDETKKGFLLGSGIANKSIVPRNTNTIGDKIYVVDETVKGVTAIGFTKITLTPITIKLQVRYGENIPDITAPGGFAVKEITDTITGESTYTALTSLSYWGEIHTNFTNWEFGIFGGLFQNTGTKEKMSTATNKVYGFSPEIKTLYRISPRLLYKINKCMIGAEVEYSAALYGKDFDVNYLPATTTKVDNTRFLFTMQYSF